MRIPIESCFLFRLKQINDKTTVEKSLSMISLLNFWQGNVDLMLGEDMF